jgi:hypothetical protein
MCSENNGGTNHEKFVSQVQNCFVKNSLAQDLLLFWANCPIFVMVKCTGLNFRLPLPFYANSWRHKQKNMTPQCVVTSPGLWRHNCVLKILMADQIWQQCYSYGRIFKASSCNTPTEYESEMLLKSYRKTHTRRSATVLVNWQSHWADIYDFRTLNTGQDKV